MLGCHFLQLKSHYNCIHAITRVLMILIYLLISKHPVDGECNIVPLSNMQSDMIYSINMSKKKKWKQNNEILLVLLKIKIKLLEPNVKLRKIRVFRLVKSLEKSSQCRGYQKSECHLNVSLLKVCNKTMSLECMGIGIEYFTVHIVGRRGQI